MTDHHQTRAQIVDLLRYRQERSQQRLDFSERPAGRPALALVRPFRTLTLREVAHRERMVEFMGKTEGRSQKAEGR